jgi:hypothetical protein
MFSPVEDNQLIFLTVHILFSLNQRFKARIISGAVNRLPG